MHTYHIIIESYSPHKTPTCLKIFVFSRIDVIPAVSKEFAESHSSFVRNLIEKTRMKIVTALLVLHFLRSYASEVNAYGISNRRVKKGKKSGSKEDPKSQGMSGSTKIWGEAESGSTEGSNRAESNGSRRKTKGRRTKTEKTFKTRKSEESEESEKSEEREESEQGT